MNNYGVILTSENFSGKTALITFVEEGTEIVTNIGYQEIPYTYFPNDGTPQGVYYLFLTGTGETCIINVTEPNPTPTPTNTVTPTTTKSPTPTNTPSTTATNTPTQTATQTPTPTVTPTATNLSVEIILNSEYSEGSINAAYTATSNNPLDVDLKLLFIDFNQLFKLFKARFFIKINFYIEYFDLI